MEQVTIQRLILSKGEAINYKVLAGTNLSVVLTIIIGTTGINYSSHSVILQMCMPVCVHRLAFLHGATWAHTHFVQYVSGRHICV